MSIARLFSKSNSSSARRLIDRLEPRVLLSAGALDTSFAGGTVSFNTGQSMSLRDAVVQADGKTVVLFSGSESSAVARFNVNGTQDTAFGLISGGGLGGGDFFDAIALQSDGKIILAGTASGSGAVAVSRLLSSGELDDGFGTSGTRFITVGGRQMKSSDVVIRPDDRIVVGGDADLFDNFDSDFALFGLTANGNIDSAFNGGSPVFTDIDFNDFIDSVELMSDGRIVAAGQSFDNTNESAVLAVALYSPAGVLDTSFSGDGVFTTTQLSDQAGRSIAIQNGTQILLLDPNNNDSEHIALGRLNAAGVFDPTFGGGDGVLPPINSGPIGTAFDGGMVVDPAGKIVIAYDLVGSNTEIARLTRLNADGSPDTTFVHQHTLASTSFLGSFDKLLNGPNNTLLIATATSTSDVLLARYDGTHAPTPAITGPASANATTNTIGVRVTYTSDVPIDQGTIGPANARLTGPAGYNALATAATNVQVSGGELSVTYVFPAPGGTLTPADNGTYQLSIDSATITDSNANIVPAQVVGPVTVAVSTGLADLAFADTTFSAGTYFQGDTILANLVPSAVGAGLASLAVEVVLSTDAIAGNGDDILLLAQTSVPTGVAITTLGPIPTSTPPGNYRLIARIDPANAITESDEVNNLLVSAADAIKIKAPQTAGPSLAIGGLDPTFGASGVIRPGLGLSSTVGALQQADGQLIIAGSQGEPGDRNLAIAKRDQSNTPDPDFGSGGVVGLDVRGTDDRISDSALLADGSILILGTTEQRDENNNPVGSDFFVVRFTADGQSDNTFGGGNPVVIDFSSDADGSPSTDVARELLIAPDGKLLIIGRSDIGGGTDLALVRLNANGTLDQSFGNGGKLTTDIAGGDDGALSATFADDGSIFVVGFATVDGVRQTAVAKYTSAGVLDTSFGGGGTTTFLAGGNDERGNAIAISPKGSIVVAGYTAAGTVANGTYDSFFLVARMNANGKLDKKFGNGGIVTQDVGDPATATYVEVLADERVVASGVSSPLIAQGQSGRTDIVIARFTDRGAPDTSLDGDGVIVISTGDNDTTSVSEQPPAGDVFLPLDLTADETLAEFQESTEGKLNGKQGGGAFAAGTNGDQTVVAAVVTSGIELSGEMLANLPTAVIGGAKQKVRVNVLNVGDLLAEGTMDITLYTSTDQTLNSGDREILTLAGTNVKLKPATFGGKAKKFNVKFNYPTDIVDGTYFLLAEVNPSQTIPELNPNNNSAFTDQTVQIAAPFIDLTGPAVTATPLTIGKASKLPVMLSNGGNVSIKSTSELILILSEDQTLDEGDTQLTGLPAKVNLKPQASKPIKLKVTPEGVTAGDYFLFVVIDSANAVSERNEANNLLSSDVASPLE